MDFQQAVRTVFNKYADFNGRALRSEFWWFVLFCLIVQLAIGILGAISSNLGNIIAIVFGLGVLIPGISVTARRLHDTDRSGWWQLIHLIPLIGLIVMIVFLTQEGTPGDNRFGPPA